MGLEMDDDIVLLRDISQGGRNAKSEKNDEECVPHLREPDSKNDT